jgi:hypothetical protein
LVATNFGETVGGGRFENITEQAGVGLCGQISVTASFADVDNDGKPDLFVTTVRHGNHLFHNLGNGKFADITEQAGLNYSGHSSGAVFFDYNRDGLVDLFLSNIGRYTSNDKIGPSGGLLHRIGRRLFRAALSRSHRTVHFV